MLQRIAFSLGPNIRSFALRVKANLSPHVACHAVCSAQAFDMTLDICRTFARMVEHILIAMHCAAAVSISQDALLVVALIIDVLADHVGRYFNS